jgi:hypothetical protein
MKRHFCQNLFAFVSAFYGTLIDAIYSADKVIATQQAML